MAAITNRSLIHSSDKKKDWNTPGTAEIELLSFETINLTSLGLLSDENVQVGRAGDRSAIDVIMNVLNITNEDTWDCHINHYRDFFWDELEKVGVAKYYKVLGWTPARWENDDPPASEDLEWFELDKNETIAATGESMRIVAVAPHTMSLQQHDSKIHSDVQLFVSFLSYGLEMWRLVSGNISLPKFKSTKRLLTPIKPMQRELT